MPCLRSPFRSLIDGTLKRFHKQKGRSRDARPFSFLSFSPFLASLYNLYELAVLRLKQIAFALFLMTSLVVGTTSACLCLHHGESTETESGHHHEEGAKAESSHHEHHDTASESSSVTSDLGDALGTSCICPINLVTRGSSSKSEIEKTKLQVHAEVSELNHSISYRVISDYAVAPNLKDDPYSYAFETFRPSRAPPRL